MSRYFLSIAAIYKNEAHVLREWIEHYLAEGVDHFYMIDNNSTDDHKTVLAPYVERGIVSLFSETQNHIQALVYNKYVFQHKDDSEWILVCDLDEFAYSRTGTLADWLRKSLGDGPINDVRMPWINFGSSGLVQQPESVVGGFLKRKLYIPEQKVSTKNIVRTRNLAGLDIHRHIINGWICVDGCMKPVQNSIDSMIGEDYIRDSGILMNHYQIQSFEWFMKVKATRGAPEDKSKDTLRDVEYFRNHDHNDVTDEVLARKRGLIS